jgi:hypothetical protein
MNQITEPIFRDARGALVFALNYRGEQNPPVIIVNASAPPKPNR